MCAHVVDVKHNSDHVQYLGISEVADMSIRHPLRICFLPPPPSPPLSVMLNAAAINVARYAQLRYVRNKCPTCSKLQLPSATRLALLARHSLTKCRRPLTLRLVCGTGNHGKRACICAQHVVSHSRECITRAL